MDDEDVTERRCVGVRVLRELPFFLPQSFTLIGASLRTSLGSMRCSAMMMMTTGVIPATYNSSGAVFSVT